MKKTVLHKAETRGDANHGWLKSKHTFSFANYHNPERMHFGALRVLNDDTVAAGMGFGTHPHANMEIISIPLEGDLEHKDSMGNITVIKSGDVQIMSAGTGVTHSEYNKNKDREVKFLQIWVFPNKNNSIPRYGQISLKPADRQNTLQEIVSPTKSEKSILIQQNAWFHLTKMDKDCSIDYVLKSSVNGVYAFVLKGDFNIAEINLAERDGLGIWDTDKITLKAISQDSELLLIEVPMNY